MKNQTVLQNWMQVTKDIDCCCRPISVLWKADFSSDWELGIWDSCGGGVEISKPCLSHVQYEVVIRVWIVQYSNISQIRLMLSATDKNVRLWEGIWVSHFCPKASPELPRNQLGERTGQHPTCCVTLHSVLTTTETKLNPNAKDETVVTGMIGQDFRLKNQQRCLLIKETLVGLRGGKVREAWPSHRSHLSWDLEVSC